MVKSLLNNEIKSLLEKALASELYVSNLYKHIANQLQRLGYFGAQSYFLKESADELSHYQKLSDYCNDMGWVAPVPAVPKMSDKISNISDALEISYEAELDLLNQYKKFYEEAEDKYDDCITATFIQQFILIQVRSVGEYGDLIAKLALNGDIYEFDEEMGKK